MSASMLKVMRPATKRLRRGLTLIEAAMVLVILALVVGAVMLYYQGANSSRQVSQVSGQIAAVQQAVRSAFAGQADLTGLDNAAISRYLPSSMTQSATGGNSTAASMELRHAFAGPLEVKVGGTTSYFTITLKKIPYDACKRLATMDMGRAALALAVADAVTDEGTPPPMSRTAANTQCGDTGTKSLTWAFQ
jgi:type II secretory pathway pseudopilin PulG